MEFSFLPEQKRKLFLCTLCNDSKRMLHVHFNSILWSESKQGDIIFMPKDQSLIWSSIWRKTMAEDGSQNRLSTPECKTGGSEQRYKSIITKDFLCPMGRMHINIYCTLRKKYTLRKTQVNVHLTWNRVILFSLTQLTKQWFFLSAWMLVWWLWHSYISVDYRFDLWFGDEHFQIPLRY